MIEKDPIKINSEADLSEGEQNVVDEYTSRMPTDRRWVVIRGDQLNIQYHNESRSVDVWETSQSPPYDLMYDPQALNEIRQRAREYQSRAHDLNDPYEYGRYGIIGHIDDLLVVEMTGSDGEQPDIVMIEMGPNSPEVIASLILPDKYEISLDHPDSTDIPTPLAQLSKEKKVDPKSFLLLCSLSDGEGEEALKSIVEHYDVIEHILRNDFQKSIIQLSLASRYYASDRENGLKRLATAIRSIDSQLVTIQVLDKFIKGEELTLKSSIDFFSAYANYSGFICSFNIDERLGDITIPSSIVFTALNIIRNAQEHAYTPDDETERRMHINIMAVESKDLEERRIYIDFFNNGLTLYDKVKGSKKLQEYFLQANEGIINDNFSFDFPLEEQLSEGYGVHQINWNFIIKPDVSTSVGKTLSGQGLDDMQKSIKENGGLMVVQSVGFSPRYDEMDLGGFSTRIAVGMPMPYEQSESTRPISGPLTTPLGNNTYEDP